MLFRLTFIISLFLFSSIGAQNKSRVNVYLTTNVPIDYELFIEGQSLFSGTSSHYQIVGLQPGKKILSIRTNTKSHQTPSIEVANTGKSEEYYVIDRIGEKYVIKRNDVGFKFKSGTIPIITSYSPMAKPKKLDSGYKQVHSCKIPDSVINKTILRAEELKDMKARMNFLDNTFKRKCLLASQVKSVGYRLDNDSLRFDFYQRYFLTSLDRINFGELRATFATQVYLNRYDNWLKNQVIQ